MLLWNVWNFSLEFWGTRGKVYLEMMIVPPERRLRRKKAGYNFIVTMSK